MPKNACRFAPAGIILKSLGKKAHDRFLWLARGNTGQFLRIYFPGRKAGDE
jgi:hypothetical protein